LWKSVDYLPDGKFPLRRMPNNPEKGGILNQKVEEGEGKKDLVDIRKKRKGTGAARSSKGRKAIIASLL